MTGDNDVPISLVNSTVELLSKHVPFDGMQRESLEFIAKKANVGYYAKGQVVTSPEQGKADRFYIVKQGAVETEFLKTQVEEDDSFRELTEGDCFPLGALLSRRAVAGYYTATRDTFLYELSSEDFFGLLRASGRFHNFCTRRLANLLERSKNKIQAQYSGAASERQSMDTSLREIIRREPASCLPAEPIKSVLQTMHNLGIGSMIIADSGRKPVGIFTLHDLLSRVSLAGRNLTDPVADVMSSDLAILPPEASAHDAAIIMAKRGIRHVIVVESGKLFGVVSERDLFSLQRVSLRQIGDSIRKAASIQDLERPSRDIRELAHNMLAQGIAAEHLVQFISTLNDLLTTRTLDLVLESELGAEAEVWKKSLCWLALGSEGRYEQTLYTDQDNGLIISPPPGVSTENAKARLLPIAKKINEALALCGFPLCKGDVMAGNPEWLLSLQEWKARFETWIEHGDPDSLLNAAIFFDFRPIYGNHALGEELRKWLTARAMANPRFLHQMAENALKNRPPLGFVRDFVGEKLGERENMVNLKIKGIGPFIDTARIYGLASGVESTSTSSRLRSAGQVLRIPAAEIEGWIGAFQFVQMLRLRSQHSAPEGQAQTVNFIDPYELNTLDRRILKESFREARKLQSRLAMDYQL